MAIGKSQLIIYQVLSVLLMKNTDMSAVGKYT